MAASPPAEKLPVPAGVLIHTLAARHAAAGTSALTSSWSLEVEVETTQGYVYTGKLVALDAHYNLTLAEATVRRERLCDLERSLARQQHARTLAGMGLSGSELAAFMPPEERPAAATRPRYAGSVLIRSNNLLLLSFPSEQPQAESTRSTAAGGAAIPPKRSAGRKPQYLIDTFKSTATSIKKALEVERRKNRNARRKRIGDAKRKPPSQ